MPQRSTFVFMPLGSSKNSSRSFPRSRGSTHRSRSTPEGRSDSESVRQGNVLAYRCFILLWIAAAKGVFWTMEQPGTSVMEYLPGFQQLAKRTAVRRLIFEMADFGAPTPKRTILYSSPMESKSLMVGRSIEMVSVVRRPDLRQRGS